MALTLNTSPANISNSASFNITTSLTEGAGYVNLRVRADITVAAAVIATLEKPVGIADFDFSDILKSMVTGISFTRDSGDLVKVTGGSPLCAYSVTFTEVYEDASAVTQTGDTDGPTAKKYVPAKSDGTAFAELVMHDASCLFASKTLRNNVGKFYSGLEYWLVMFTEVAHCELFYSKDGGAYDHATHFDPSEGWAAIVINTGELMDGVTSNLRIQIGEVGGAKISEVITIYVDSTAIDERTVLEYDGLFGGKEYLAFEGLKDIQFATVRNYHVGEKKNRKALSFTGINRQRLETLFKDINNAEYLKSLLTSESVKKLVGYVATDVTIVTDTVKISNSDMFTNQIDIEYEY